MCDCFHLAFPNWHAPAAGAGRRLTGPEQDVEEDSVCAEPEILESERPRPQGSSPIEEFPIEKQAEDDISNLAHKSGSNKKSRKAGFGALFDKRTSDKMNEAEDMQSGESEMIVKTVKEACVEGLVVTGGGKEGIFIKEVKVDSPASKHLSVKEGDQILSATVYFDNVSYEDALKILEHAQPYKMEFCLRRQVEPTIPENDEIIHPKEKDQGSPTMRSQRKIKKQQERISWPKFPSFGKGPRVQFKRSHSTSEAEEHRKLEMSPPTSDTESPLKSPLKCADGKDKKKKHKVNLKVKMKGHRSKSVEEAQSNEKELVCDNQQVDDILEEKIPEGHEEKMLEISQVLDGSENKVSPKTVNDDSFQSVSVMELHKAHLISLGNTLKTTDISVALAEEGKIESSKMKVRFPQIKKPDVGTESHAETIKALYTTSDTSACDNVVLSQTGVEISQLENDISKEEIGKGSSEKQMESGNAELLMPNIDIGVGVTRTSVRDGNEKQRKEKSVFENESYGIRTRGPLADMATSKTHFVSTVNGLQFMSPKMSEEHAVDKDIPIVKTSKLPTQTNDFILADLAKRSESEFKLPKVDHFKFATHELIKKTEVEEIRTQLPKREDIEIPGMENKEIKPNLQTPEIKVPKIEKIINITKERVIQDPQEFNVEDVKVAVSKFPAFKLPEGDITGVLVQREIEMKSDKSTLTPRGSPHKISITSTDSGIIMPKTKIGEEMSLASDAVDKDRGIKIPEVELTYIDEQTSTAVIKIAYTPPQKTDYGRFEDLNFKLPKREDIEIPGMEAIKESNWMCTADLDQAEKPKTKKHGDKKCHEKKSKKSKITVEGSESTKPDTKSPDFSTELPKKYSSKTDTGEPKIHEKQKFKTPNIGEFENIDVQIQESKILEDNMDLPQKTETKFVNTKFKIPSTTLPEFGTKVPVEEVDISAVDVKVKVAGKKLPGNKMKLSDDPSLTYLDGTDANKDGLPDSGYDRAQDTETEGQGRKFKLPKFELSFPEVKAPRMICTSKKDDDSSVSEEYGIVPVVHSPKAEPSTVKHEVSGDLPDTGTEITEVKIKRPGFSFPRFGISKSEHAPLAANVPSVDMSLPEGHTQMDNLNTNIAISVKDGKQKDATKFASPTKFKIPSIKFPNFGVKEKATMETSDVAVDIKGPDISLPHTEPILVDIKEPDVDKQKESVSMQFINMDSQSEAKGSNFKFGVSLPEVKGQQTYISSDKAEIDISVPKAKVEMHPPDVELQGVTAEMKADLPEVDSKGLELKMKTPVFTFPKIELSKSELKAPKADASLPNIEVCLPEGSTEIERPSTDLNLSMEDAEQKDPTKFKLPSVNFPKFTTKGPKASVEVSDVDADVKGPEICFPGAEMKLSFDPLSVDIKGPDADKEFKPFRVEMKDQDIQMKEQGSKFKLPKFGISLPEVKGPKIDISSDKAEIDISVPKAKVEMHPPDVEVQGVTAEIKADLPEVDSKGLELKMKTPGFSFHKIELSKSEVKAPEGDVSLPNVDVSLPEGSMEIDQPTTDVTIPDVEKKGRSKFGSPTKFKLPSINFPKFGTKGPKASVELPDVDVEVKGPEINLPEAEMKLNVEPLSVDIKGLDADKDLKLLSVEMKDQDIQMKEQGSKFKLPKFGISLPEVKGPKIDVSSDKAEIDISVPKAKVEMHPPDVQVQGMTAEIKADLPEVDSKGLELKMKTPGFSFPKIELSKSEVKAPEVDASLQNVDVSLPEGSMEIDQPTTDVTIPDVEQKGRSKFGSPTKFKLPSINLPVFGIKGSKTSVELSDVDVEIKGPEINLPEAEMKLSAEPLAIDIKGPDADKELEPFRVEMKDQDIQMKEQGSKFKLPNFGISLPEVKGPKIDISSNKAEIDISVPKAKVEMHLPDVEVQGVTAEIKADLPEVDSKGLELKMKTPGFSFPKIELSKSEVKAPEGDVSLPNVDVSLPEGSMEIDQPTTDVTIPDMEKKGQSKFGSPTKFKLPSINFPKFGTKGPKASVELPDVDVEVKGPEINLPEAEMKLSAEPLFIDIKGPDADKELEPFRLEMKDQDIQMKEQGRKFKLPNFGISLPEIKGPKIDISSRAAEIDISVPKAKVEMHPPDVEVQGVKAEIKADLPEVDSKGLELKMKTPGFSFPKIELSKSEVKAPKGDVSLPNVDVSLPEGSMEIDQTTTDVTIPDVEKKGRSKFGSPTKFKLPSINFPKFGTKGPKASVELPDVDVEVKGPEINIPEAEMKLSAEPLSVGLNGPDADKEFKLLSVEVKDQDIQMKEQGSKFKLPKFGISLPEVKGPKIDISSDKAEIDISVPKAKVEMHPPDVEVQGVTAEIKADLPEVDSKGLELKMKTPGFSFPKIELSRSEVKAPEGDVSLPNVDVSLPEGSMEIDQPTTDVTIPDVEKKGRSKFGSPTKFKLPSINFPKFGTKGPKASVELPDVDVEVKGPEINLPEAEMKLSAEPLSIDIKGPDADKELESFSLEMKSQDIQMKEQGSKFKLPNFGISLPEIKGPKIDVSSNKAEIDISVPKAKVEMHPPDVEVQGVTAEIKADLPEVDSKGLELKMKTPGFSFPKIELSRSEVKAPEGDVSLPNVDVSLPEGSMEIDQPTTDVTIPDIEKKGRSKFGSPTKFKLPSINFPKFGTKGPKASVELPDVDVEVKGPEINIPEAEIKLNVEPLSVDIKGLDADRDLKPLSVEVKDQDIQMKEQGSKFKLPKFGISLPEVKGPKIDVSSDKAEIDISVPKAKVEMHPPDVQVQGMTAEIKASLPEVDSKGLELKMKTPGFSFPKIELSKSEVKAPEVDASLQNVDVSLPEGSMEIDQPTTDVTIPDVEQKGRSKFGSPTKFKLPSINLPMFGIKGPKASVELPDVDVEIKGPEINLPEAEMKLSAEPLSIDIKGPDADKELEPFRVEMKDQDIQMKEQGSKFKLPKFGISLPEVQGPKIDVSSDKAEIDISVPKAKVEMHPPDVQVQVVTAEIKADLPEVDSKGLELKMKTPGFSFPKIELSKSEVKAPKGDVSLPNVDVSLPEGSMEIDQPTTDVTIPDVQQKGHSKFGSPTKFKLPSINLPKFGTKGPKASVELPDVDVEVKGPEINLPEAEMKLSAEPLSIDMKGPDADKELEPFRLEMKDQDIQMKEQGRKFKLPNFGISLPEIKGPKIDISSRAAEIDISVPKAKVEMHPPDVEVQGVTAEIKADLPEVDSKGLELKMKTPGFSFPKIELSKSEVKAPKGDVSLPNVDVSLPEGSMEIDQPTTDVTIPDVEKKGRSKFGSPTKFKLPSINFPKFGTKGPKASVELPDVDVEVKGPEINLPEAEMKLNVEPLSVDIKGPDADKDLKPLSVEVKDQDIQMKEQGSKFKLPKFGISLPEVKGPKIDISSDKAETDISVPKAKVEMHPPDVEVQGVTAEIKADLPEVDSKGLELKMKMPGFSFPKIESSKSEIKAPKGDVSLPNVDVSLPEGSMEIDQTTTDVTIPDVEKKGRSKFGSPTKFKLPSINFPKFGTKGPKASVELPDVDVEVKGPEINIPEAEMKLNVEPLSVDIKGLDADKELESFSLEMKNQDIQMKEQGSKFKLPKFGISLPEVKGPKIDISSDKAEIDISVPKAKVEMHPPDVEVQGVTAEIKADLPEVDSKGLELKMKTPGFSFPKIELSKSEIKAPKGDVSLPNVDVSLPEGSMEIDQPTTDVTIPDVEKKGRSKFGSPTKFKLPSINFPKFGTKGPKASVELPDVDVEVKGPEINLPEAEMKLNVEPLSVDIKGLDADKDLKPLSVEVKDQDIQMKEQGSKFKLPKFGISLPEVKGPKIDISSDKAEIDISVPKAKVEMHPPDVQVQVVTAEIKADLPEVDSKGLDLKMKTPGFSFPKIELSKSEVKAPKGDVSLPNVDVSLPEGSMEIDQPTTDVTIPDVEQKGRSKFGSPTKFKLPSINFPKFGTKGPKASVEFSDVDVDVKGPEMNLPETEIKLPAEPLSVGLNGPDADKEFKPLSVEVKDQDIQMKEQGSKFKLPKFEFSLPEIKGPRLYGTLDKADIDIAVPKAQVEVHPANVEVHGVTAEMIADLPEVDSKYAEVKMKTPVFSSPGIGFGKPEVKLPEGNASLPNVDVSLPERSMEIDQPTADVTIPDVEQKGRSKFGSPTKFKLPSISFPKFGTKGPKASVEVSDVDVDVIKPARSLPHAEIKLSAEPLSVNIKGPELDKEIKSVSLEMKDQDIKTKEQGSKFKLPKFGISLSEVKGPKFDVTSDKAEIDISVQKAQVEVYPPNVEVEGVTAEVKADLREVDSKDIGVKCIISDSKTNNEVAKAELDSQEGKCGNEDTAVDSNALDVILEPTQKYKEGDKMSSKFILPTLRDVFSGFEVEFNVPTFDEIEETKKKISDPPVQIPLQLPSPIKDNEKITFQLRNKTEHSPQTDIESRKSFTRDTRDIDEDNVSPTLSLSSSDAFADVSSALTSEQIGLSLTSPTKVKVKYSEPTANAEVSDVHGDIITSTARTQIISMEPHQPEKVNIPFSSETSSSSVDTLKQMSGHIVVSNVQNVSKTEHATILTKVDTQTLPPEKATDSMFSVEETIMRTGHTIVEKHVVKEIFGDDKEKIFVTQRIQVYEGDSTEPISDDTASSIQKLRDSVHTEKIRFFEEAESSQTILMTTETLLRHADSSPDENGEK
ncbi:neuroblast differentiation-associated protein AHNAK-like [Tachysurus fulvidraco]|uniref:neuroblast differentiation-associated protein AHNAK-like n=1 Tax=Tachysurus fulvidraco TaxID=1234273 RepID=UPI001FEE48E3|nr:neuroblast differentiation-associated protein AHNAK-like [Tachysurus fulvidraco]